MNETPHISRLDELGIACNTDKSSRNRVRPDQGAEQDPGAAAAGHDYLRKYEFFLRRFVDKPAFRLLELGAGPDWNIGASARLWRQYFTRTDFRLRIADIKESAANLADDATEVLVGDLGKRPFLEMIARGSHDVIIDDASHFWGHQILAFNVLFKSLREGGVYIIEDIHTSFGKMRDRYRRGSSDDAYSALMLLATQVAGKGRKHPLLDGIDEDRKPPLRFWREIESITFINHSCIVVRNGYY